MYNHPTLAATGAAATPTFFGELWVAIGLITLLFAGLAMLRLMPKPTE